MVSIIRAFGKELQVKRFLNKVELLEYLLQHPEEHWQELHGATTIPTGTYKRKHQQTPRPKAECTCHRELHTLKIRLVSLVS